VEGSRVNGRYYWKVADRYCNWYSCDRFNRSFLLFRIGKRMAASASKLLENALLSIQGRERNSSKVVLKGWGITGVSDGGIVCKRRLPS
jgi:hypothetical protein